MSCILPLKETVDVACVGGKAANLGELIRAGFSVPDGFVISACADPVDDETIRAAYGRIGGGRVAVRSSAAAEDGATASMAGQFETILNVVGDDALLAAVRQCRASAASDRVRAYESVHGLGSSVARIAVVVQKQVAADVAGVLFTADPTEPFPRQMRIEASWGLGESVVSGEVRPDCIQIDYHTGEVKLVVIADKKSELTAAGESEVDAARRSICCLNETDLRKLWDVGRRIETHFGRAQDVEWAFAGGELFILQSRPITTLFDSAAVEQVVHDARPQLNAGIEQNRGPWVLHNLAETLPHPTPLTWSVIRRFMSADGGFGRAYAKLGFEPSGEWLDLIAGRIYQDASRARLPFGRDLPLAYDTEELKRNAGAVQQSPAVTGGSLYSRLHAARLFRNAAAKLAERADCEMPGFTDYVLAQKRLRLRELGGEDLVGVWQRFEAMVWGDVAAQEVTCGLRAGYWLEQLQQFLAEHIWDQDAAALARELSSAGEENVLLVADAQLYAVGRGERSLEDWLAHHGHRGVGEMELASPRWREQPSAAMKAARQLAGGESPAERRERHLRQVRGTISAIRAKLAEADRPMLDKLIRAAADAVVTREWAKDQLMLGHDLLRDVALAAGELLRIGDGVFYLTREQLFEALRRGQVGPDTIAAARHTHSAESQLTALPFIDAEAAAAFGEKRKLETATALAISAGVAVGPALVAASPEQTQDASPGYVLVCPSTDPSWTAAFARAAALVVESGGSLSHGAVVAREMGLPAVVMPDATRRFKTGDVLRVDGDTGDVRRADDDAERTPTAEDQSFPPSLVPPPPGRKDRRAATIRNRAAAIWCVLLIGFFALPDAWLRWPVFSIFDAILWPLVGIAGWPITVGLIALLTATLTLLLQRQLTDNRRLLETKHRRAALRTEAARWPVGSPRRRALLSATAGGSGRLLGASLVPAGLLLGPMVMGFVWLGERAEPSKWNGAGSAVRVVAMVDGESTLPVTLTVKDNLAEIDPTTPATQALPPIRQTLADVLKAATDSSTREIIDWPKDADAAQLKQFLNSPIPPQGMTWVLRPPAGFDGRLSVNLSGAGKPMVVPIAIGSAGPPSPTHFAGPGGSSLTSVDIVYPRPAVWQTFLRLAGVDVGWVGVYVGVYVLALAIVRRLARVA